MEWGRRTFSPLLWLLAINKENTYVVSYRGENEENERTRKTSKWWGNPMTYVLGPGDELSRKFLFPLTPLFASQDRSLSESAIGV